MKKDPLGIMISLIHNLNLLEEEREFSINEFKNLCNLNFHWTTVKKYLKIIQLNQKYAPKISLERNKLKIIHSHIYNRLNLKEKLVVYLFIRRAFNKETAVKIPSYFNTSETSESLNYLFEKTKNKKYFLNKPGIELYNSINEDISDLIYNEKEISDVFFEIEPIIPAKENETAQGLIPMVSGWIFLSEERIPPLEVLRQRSITNRDFSYLIEEVKGRTFYGKS